MKTPNPGRTWIIPVTSTLVLAAVVMTLTGCQKDIKQTTADNGNSVTVVNPADTVAAKSAASLTQTIPFPDDNGIGCDFAPDYGTTLIQPQPVTGSDYMVSPLNNKNVDGIYLAWPGGLVIDSHTGAIDVTKSETGAKYAIGFVHAGARDTCISYITLGGADYVDSVYAATVSPRTAAPHFDGSVGGPSPCVGSGCQFDYNHLAKKQGVYVDGHNGSIDIKNTLQHSLFALFPVDGMYFYTTIQYKANNASNNAEQSIQVKLMYYHSRSAIPASLLNTISTRASGIVTGTLSETGVTRPPIIIITRNQ